MEGKGGEGVLCVSAQCCELLALLGYSWEHSAEPAGSAVQANNCGPLKQLHVVMGCVGARDGHEGTERSGII